MAKLQVERAEYSGVISYTFTSKGLDAHADFDPRTGRAHIKFEEAENMASALETVVRTLQHQASVGTNPILSLRVEIDAGRFTKKLRKIAPNFDLKVESGDHVIRFHGEFSVPQNSPVLS